jgi:hypothetical protein
MRSPRNRVEIVVQIKHNRRAMRRIVAVQMWRNRCEIKPIAAQSLRNRCAIAAQSLRNWLITLLIDAQSLRNRFSKDISDIT